MPRKPRNPSDGSPPRDAVLWTEREVMAYTRYSRPTLARKRRDDPNWPKPIRIGGPGGALRYKAQEVKDWVERQPRV